MKRKVKTNFYLVFVKLKQLAKTISWNDWISWSS